MVKNNILVTGGFGLLGKPLVLKLINSNNNVFILERKSKISSDFSYNSQGSNLKIYYKF